MIIDTGVNSTVFRILVLVLALLAGAWVNTSSSATSLVAQ